MDLVPPALIANRYFATEQTTIDTLLANHETAANELEEFKEEHLTPRPGTEDGLLANAVNDKGNLTKNGVQKRLLCLTNDPDDTAERLVLQRCLTLIETEANAAKTSKQARAALNAKVFARYAQLTEVEIKVLVVDDKWFTSLRNGIDSEVQRIVLRLSARVTELEERYAQSLPELERNAAALTRRVKGHLARMGVSL